MFCENCGKELKENAKFCENCGAKVTIVPQSAVPAEPEVQENVYTQDTSQPEAPQTQEGWQDQSAVQESPQFQQGWQDPNAGQGAPQPQQGWQEQPQSSGFGGAVQGGPQPQQGWQDPNAGQGGPQPQQGWQDPNAGQGGPQPQQNWQSQPQNSGFGGAPQGSGDLKEQFMTIVGLGKPVSGMSIGALVLTLLCCGLVGVILAIVDIVNDKEHTQNHLLSVIAIAVAIIGFLAGFSGGAAAIVSDSIGGVF